jgi:hypothetical protein
MALSPWQIKSVAPASSTAQQRPQFRYPVHLYTSYFINTPSLLMAPQRSACHVGVAFHTVPGFPTQWSVVLSQSQRFEGKVWCTTISETTNGRGTFWKHLDWSPSRLDPMALFSGVIWVAKSTYAVSTLQNWVSSECIIPGKNDSESPTWDDIGRDSEEFAGLVLLRIFEGGYILLPDAHPPTLTSLIRDRLPDLQAAERPDRGSYPILSIDTGKITYARAKLL